MKTKEQDKKEENLAQGSRVDNSKDKTEISLYVLDQVAGGLNWSEVQVQKLKNKK